MTKTNSNSGAKRKTGKNPKAKGPNQWTKVGSAQKTPSKTANGKSKTATITPSATATKPATIESMFGNQFVALAKEEEKQEALEEQKEKMEIAKKEAEEEAKKLRGGKKLSYTFVITVACFPIACTILFISKQPVLCVQGVCFFKQG